MEKSVVQLWNDFIKYGNHVRRNRLKGNVAWELVKNELKKIDFRFGSWGSVSVQYYDAMKKLKLYGDTSIDQVSGQEVNDSQDQKLWEADHFMLQHGRIVHNNKPSLLRLLQVAFNIGQLEIELERNPDLYTPDQLKYYTDETNDTKNIRSYISDEDIKLLQQSLNQSNHEIVQAVYDVIQSALC
jgi:hypothetical protein